METYFSTFCIELIWEIGYFATSIALLRVNEGIFNTYSYLENVLDIFNGFLFSFTTITAIRITRAMGCNNSNEAYKHAKYSIYDAYFKLIFTALPCYVFIHIFRFLS